MKKEKKSESIADQLLFIKDSFKVLSDENSENKAEILEKSIKKVDEIIKFFNGVRKILLFLLITSTVLLILLFISLYFIDKATTITTEIEDIKTDTIANQILEVKKVMMSDSTFQTSYTYQTKNNKIVSYNQLLREIDSLEKILISKDLKINSLENELSTSKNKIDLAQEHYGIRFWKTYQFEKKEKVEYINIQSKKIDSALMLLDVYRDRLFFNKETKKWEIR